MELSELDRQFMEAFPEVPESSRPFLGQLMAVSRRGYLCLRHDAPLRLEGTEGIVVCDENRYYLQRNWILETTLVHHLQRLIETPPSDLFDSPSFLPGLSEEQNEVLRRAFECSLTLVTGGPGTGKSFTAARLVDDMVRARKSSERALHVCIAAPTGRAADHLARGIRETEGLKLEVMTLHRLLRLRPGLSRLFEENSLDADLILIDEASMVNASLFGHLLKSIRGGTRLVMFGDADQLPPVDGGGVFADMATLLAVPLRQCYRTQERPLQELYESARCGNAEMLMKVLEPIPEPFLDWMEQVLGSSLVDDLSTVEEIVQRFGQRRFLCPLRKGPLGVDAINAALLHRLRGRLSPGQRWAAPILITGNDAELKVYNGMAGTIAGRHQEGEEIILADGRTYRPHQIPGYEIAFALSVHKSQGSEFDEVLCWLPAGSEEFGREALYTALTRAKKSVRFFGDGQTIRRMASTKIPRENGIRERLIPK